MRISAKGRYGLSAMIYLAQNSETTECISVLKVSEFLGVSKIYLEQVFALLKKADLVVSIKGSSGGYQLSRSSDHITSFEILNAIEVTLFEATENALSDSASYINTTLESMLWSKLDEKVKGFLNTVTLSDLVTESSKNQNGIEYMYFL
ncbi:Rrf2 family transcriptional regulator [Oscillospiraceae bacterium PP1C4]